MRIPLAVPIITAPFGGDGLFFGDGHQSVARANAACGTVSIVPEVGSFSYEQVAAAAPAAARIGQLHPFDSFDHVARRIKAAGYDALCVTVDCPMMGFRARNRMARFRFDPAVWSGNVTDDGAPNVAAVVIGRLAAYGLAAAGERGVRRTIELLTAGTVIRSPS